MKLLTELIAELSAPQPSLIDTLVKYASLQNPPAPADAYTNQFVPK